MLSVWGCLGKGSWVSLGEEIHSSSFFPQQCCCAGNWQCACLHFKKERAGISFERYPCNPNFMFLIKMYSQKCLISEKCVMRRDRWSIPTQEKCHNLVMALGVIPRIKHHTYFLLCFNPLVSAACMWLYFQCSALLLSCLWAVTGKASQRMKVVFVRSEWLCFTEYIFGLGRLFLLVSVRLHGWIYSKEASMDIA